MDPKAQAPSASQQPAPLTGPADDPAAPALLHGEGAASSKDGSPRDDARLADADGGGATEPARVHGTLPMELWRLERRFVAYSLVGGLMSCLFLYGLLAALALFLVQRLPDHAQWIWIAAVAVAALLAVWTVVAPPLAYARWRYGMDAELLLVRHGILWHEERTIPISRMQHVDLSRGPLERWFGLATLVVFTAGSEAASVRIPGLAVPTAGELRDRILEARGFDVV